MVGWHAVLLVTIVKSSEVDCAVDDELIEAAAPLSTTPTVFELAVGRAFKWDRGAPQWAAETGCRKYDWRPRAAPPGARPNLVWPGGVEPGPARKAVGSRNRLLCDIK